MDVFKCTVNDFWHHILFFTKVYEEEENGARRYNGFTHNRLLFGFLSLLKSIGRRSKTPLKIYIYVIDVIRRMI